ncbi:MAG: SOS response-associated peptidase [Lacunisphaera sp.]
MCNRFSASQWEAIRIYGKEIIPVLLRTKDDWADWLPKYNIPPTSRVPVIVNDQDAPRRLMSWGTQTNKGMVMNARSETLLEKSLWQQAALVRRCVMLADGFFEWETIGRRKLGHYLSLKDRRPFAMAGVWFPVSDDQPERVVMVTNEPNALVAPFHDRMPTILSLAAAREWLEIETIQQDDIVRLCRPYPVEEMNEWRSPPEMNSLAFQSPEALQPWKPEPDLFG